jgi:biofilm PGA synthesis N-glycosyltransferase PgaC
MILRNISYALYYASISVFLLVFLVNPFLLAVLAFLKRKADPGRFAPQNVPISIIVVTQGNQKALDEKLNNLLALDYPQELVQYIFYLDGADPAIVQGFKEKPIANLVVLHSSSQIGKNEALNLSVQACTGEILVFSDADVLMSPHTVNALVNRFGEEDIGGVCGKIEILNEEGALIQAQKDYLSFDRFIKNCESKIGTLSTNSGAVYAIRKTLFRSFPLTVTDDFFSCLSVNLQGFRFAFDSDAVKASSRDSKHEVQRRRRIVCRSLTGIYMMRSLLNPFQYGVFSISLFLNKVLRRFLPFFLIALYIGSGILAFQHPLIMLVFILQSVCYLLALIFGLLSKIQRNSGIFHRLCGACYYFCLGNYGTLLGVIDFFRGRQYISWRTVLG